MAERAQHRGRCVGLAGRVLVLALPLAVLLASCGGASSRNAAQTAAEGGAIAEPWLAEAHYPIVAVAPELVEATAALQPQAVATIATRPVAALSEYGFTLPLPEDALVQVAGIIQGQASTSEGQLLTSDGGVSAVLIWTAHDLGADGAIESAFQVLQATLPQLALRPLQQGEITVDDHAGSYGAFIAWNGEEREGLGLLGGWTCGNGHSFSLTVAGRDATAVERSFAQLTGGFRCTA